MTIRRLEWTTEPPKQEGWYWHYKVYPEISGVDFEVLEVVYETKRRKGYGPSEEEVNGFGVWHEAQNEMWFDLCSDIGGYWLGPLPIPDPPK